MGELKILGKINLPPREKPKSREDLTALLEERMSAMAQEVNKNYGHFLREDGSIDALGEGYNKAEAEEDQKHLALKEEVWAKESGKSLDKWLFDREHSKPNLLELAITNTMHKVWGERFIVARASKYDDYENGVDNVLIDKQTGAVVCGFDEVVAKGDEREAKKKEDKILNKAKRGGAYIKYGATLKDGILLKKKLKNIPAFYLSVNQGELDDLLRAAKTKEVLPVEKKILKELLASLRLQLNRLEELDAVKQEDLKNNLLSFQDSLSVLEKSLL